MPIIIAKAVITLGLTLGVNVIAEGVELAPQLAFFREHHCAEWQGFLLSRPATAEQCERILFESRGQRVARYRLAAV